MLLHFLLVSNSFVSKLVAAKLNKMVLKECYSFSLMVLFMGNSSFTCRQMFLTSLL
jgi:hypothetical protein